MASSSPLPSKESPQIPKIVVHSDPLRRHKKADVQSHPLKNRLKALATSPSGSPKLPRAPPSTPTLSNSPKSKDYVHDTKSLQKLSRPLLDDTYSAFHEAPREKFKNFLRNTLVMSIPAAFPTIIAIDSQSTVEDALVLLGGHKIFSAPLYNSSGDFIGMIRMDLIVQSLLKKDLSMIPFILSQPVTRIADPMDKVRTISEEESFEDLLRVFSSGAPRVLVVNADNEVQQVLSESAVLPFLLHNFPVMENWLFKSLHKLGMISSDFTTVKNSATALETLQKLLERRISAVAIVDKHDHLCDMFGTSQLKLIDQENASSISQTIEDFLAHFAPRKITTCSENENLATVLMQMAIDKTQQAWVVDKKKKIQGVFALSDFLHKILESQGSTPSLPKKKESSLSIFGKKLETSRTI